MPPGSYKRLMALSVLLVGAMKKPRCSAFLIPRALQLTINRLYAMGDYGNADYGAYSDKKPETPKEGLAEHQAAVDAFELRVLFEDEHMVVVDKPPGMLCVAGRFAGKKDSLAAMVARHFRHKDVARTVVHRLDQGTSGVICFARTESSLRDLHAQFRDKSIVQKRYTALVWGDVAQEEGSINMPLRKDLDNPPKQMVDMQEGKPSLTQYYVRQRRNGITHLDLVPVTGRTHQLRVHLSEIEHPILGDVFYAHPEARHSELSGGRLCLHAEELSLRHPFTGKPMTFTSPSPFQLPDEKPPTTAAVVTQQDGA